MNRKKEANVVVCFDTKRRGLFTAVQAVFFLIFGFVFSIEALLAVGIVSIILSVLMLYRFGKPAIYISDDNLFSVGLLGYKKRINILINRVAVLENNKLFFITQGGVKWVLDNPWLSDEAISEVAKAVSSTGVLVTVEEKHNNSINSQH